MASMVSAHTGERLGIPVMTSSATGVQHAYQHKAWAQRAFGARSGFWEMLDEMSDPSVIRQLHPVSCGPACGAMLLRSHNVIVTQSAVALCQSSVLTHDAARLAEAMNMLAGAQSWLGAF